ncbi:MAG TPA: hypothetical protein DEG71_10305 [Clostridiales bacterium]|nr:hypothetical protein [Clostridiales bacterium]
MKKYFLTMAEVNKVNLIQELDKLDFTFQVYPETIEVEYHFENSLQSWELDVIINGEPQKIYMPEAIKLFVKYIRIVPNYHYGICSKRDLNS